MATYCSGVGDQLGQAQVREDAHAAAAHGRAAGQGDHRHAHPEGIHRGGAAVIGEGIEAEIERRDSARDTRAKRDLGDEFDAIGGDAASWNSARTASR